MKQMAGRCWQLPLLALLLGMSWGPALAGPFQFDDWNVIVSYSGVHSLAAWWDAMPGIRPLLKLSYALNWTVSPAPFGFHLVNLLLHAINALLLFGWICLTFAREANGNEVRHASTMTAGASPVPERTRLAALASLIWLLHPATTEAVTYISGRSISLAATFALLALLLQARGGRFVAIALAVCTLLALAVRETMWVLPVILWLAAWWRGATPDEAWRQTRGSFFVVAVAALFYLQDSSHQRMLWTAFAARDGASQLWTQIEGWRWLIAQALLLDLSNIDPDIPLHSSATPGGIAGLAALIALLAGAVWRFSLARGVVAAGLLWFMLWLLPGNGFVPRLDVANDRHLYLPLVAPALALAWFLSIIPPLQNFAWVRPRGVAALAALLLLAWLTLARNLDYLDEKSLWASTVRQSPEKSRAWNNLGVACQKIGDIACARDAFRRAIALDPNDLQPRVNLHFLQDGERPGQTTPDQPPADSAR